MNQRQGQLVRAAAAAALAAAVMTGCGGGGSDDPIGGAVPAPLSASNYVTAASIALESPAQVLALQEYLTGAQVTGTQSVLRLAVAKAFEWPLRRRGAETVTGATITETEECSEGGSVSYQATYANEGRTSAGDSVEITFSGCREWGTTVNGKLSAVIDSLSGDIDGSDQYRITLSATATNLAATDAESSYTGNGRFTLTVESFTYNRQDISVSLPSFTVTGRMAGEDYSRTFSQLTLTERWSENLDLTMEGDGRIAASELDGGYIDIDTTTPFFEAWENFWPTLGTAIIDGAGGSRVRLTAQAGGQVLIELDAQGDGTYEISTTRSWDELGGG